MNHKSIVQTYLTLSLLAFPGYLQQAMPQEAQLVSQEPYSYEVQAQAAQRARQIQSQHRAAKNVILFLGDGMGVTTITAARIFEGQLHGEPGEENSLFFEDFDHLALSKTYNTNQQTPDSSGTMTAIMTGYKTKAGVVNYDEHVLRGDHLSLEEFGGESKRMETLIERFEREGKSTGIVTTARLTHATPACCYAHSPNRDWESDNTRSYGRGLARAVEAGFKDIARQLIEFPYGDGLEVAMGGGRKNFYPQNSTDPETGESFGERMDGRILPDEWLKRPGAEYVVDRAGLNALDIATTDKLLGLFEADHMKYEADRIPEAGEPDDPSLSEMSVKAVQMLRKNQDGFFLMVEGGRIDHAHHAANAYRALTETVSFSDAVRSVVEELTPEEREETLIIVTADHSHTFTIAGYPTRGNPIMSNVIGNDGRGLPSSQPSRDSQGRYYTTLGYANGPGYIEDRGRDGRQEANQIDTTDKDYHQAGIYPLGSETHGAEDVTIYATGPGSQMFRGTREQNYIYHVINEALKP